MTESNAAMAETQASTLASAQASSKASARAATQSLTAFQLTTEHRDEALAFLAVRPLHTVIMAGYIRDHGLMSPLNRGTFYGCRDSQGRLKGVALVGHATLVEARVDAALAAFARVAQEASPAPHMIMGEQEEIGQFWNYYSEQGHGSRLLGRELLLEQRWPVEVRDAVRGLRRATIEDVKLVIPAHAQMAFEESRVNPLEADPVGFRMRCERRLEQGRTWVVIDGARLIFKADIIAETPEAVYIEGVYVDRAERGKGYGLRCVSQLSRSLLENTSAVCLLVNEQNRRAQAMYRKAGYKLRAYYDIIFPQR
ncbi:MAG TPA: GNAT family N-acetyltransferase [Pyrinomonadaceae bacterium]|jgi:predicted GNAT family acetyltransferase|nr:GNAT family N-acetyltransferase [Pyrinomonadaceae bacterium]